MGSTPHSEDRQREGERRREGEKREKEGEREKGGRTGKTKKERKGKREWERGKEGDERGRSERGEAERRGGEREREIQVEESQRSCGVFSPRFWPTLTYFLLPPPVSQYFGEVSSAAMSLVMALASLHQARVPPPAAGGFWEETLYFRLADGVGSPYQLLELAASETHFWFLHLVRLSCLHSANKTGLF